MNRLKVKNKSRNILGNAAIATHLTQCSITWHRKKHALKSVSGECYKNNEIQVVESAFALFSIYFGDLRIYTLASYRKWTHTVTGKEIWIS